MAARMAILKAVRQLAVEAKVYVHIRKFQVINQARLRNLNTHLITRSPQGRRFAQVGAVSIDAKLDCDAFASTHSATSHYDRASFVGACVRACPNNRRPRRALSLRSPHRRRPRLASWRREHLLRCALSPPRTHAPRAAHTACACAEIYSTGKANLPGSTRQRDLLSSFSRMVSELLRHSDRPEMCDLIPEHLRLCHQPQKAMRDDAPVLARSKAKASTAAPAGATVADLFGTDGDWSLGPLNPVTLDVEQESAEDDDLLELAGF